MTRLPGSAQPVFVVVKRFSAVFPLLINDGGYFRVSSKCVIVRLNLIKLLH